MSVPDASATDPSPVVQGRSCDGCTLCCKLLEVEALKKPFNRRCSFCDTRNGCRIYDTRPAECRSFHCGFLTWSQLDDAWLPSRSKLVVVIEPGGHTIRVQVDPDRPDAWKREPFYSRLKEWAAEAARARGQVIVGLGQRIFVVLPDRDVDLGIVERNEIVVTAERQGPRGVELQPFKMKRDDPRARQLLPYSSRQAIAIT